MSYVKRTKAVKKAIKDFYESSSEFLDQPVNFAFVDSNLQFELCETHACHSGLKRTMRRGGGGRPYNIFDAITFCAGDKWDIEKAYRYIDFLLNRSYIKHAYVDRDPFVVLDSGVFWMNCSVHCNYMSHACVSNRSLSNNWHLLETWIELVDLGVEENVAIYLSHNLEKEGDRWLIRQLSDAHHASRSGLSFTNARNMIGWCNNPDNLYSATYTNNETYSQITSFFTSRIIPNDNFFYRDASKIVDMESLDKTVFPKTSFDTSFVKDVKLAAMSPECVLKIAKKLERSINYDFQDEDIS